MADDIVTTRMLVLYPDGRKTETEVMLVREPGREILCRLVEPFLDDKPMEHVTVLFEGKRGDMFVDETGALDGLPANAAATDIYYAAWEKSGGERVPGFEICGVAVVFDRQVWF